MSSWMKRGGIVLGVGVALGLGAVAWVRTHPGEAIVVDSKGGSVPINTKESPAPTLDPLALRVVPVDPGSTQNSAQAGQNNNSTVTESGSAAPSPTDFKQYDQYKEAASALFGDIKDGTGEALAAGKVATVAYRGWLTDGTVFDEALTSKPFSFTEGQHRVIDGWEEGLLGMKAGGQRRLIIPPAVGYGKDSHGPIPAGSVLVFDVELISVK